MTKKEIVKKISDEMGLTQLKTKEIVQRTLDAIIETLVRDKRIELRNFGVFEVKQRAARKARNPRTGAKVAVPPKNVVTFKPGKEMEKLVRMIDPSSLPVLGEDRDDEREVELGELSVVHLDEPRYEEESANQSSGVSYPAPTRRSPNFGRS